MAENSRIEWCDHSFNPWWGCQKVSPGCANCYAETLSKRTGRTVWGPTAPRMQMSEANWRKPLKWNRDAEAEGVAKRVFTASMADVFEDRPELNEPRERLFRLIEATPWLQWLILSKRPLNMLLLAPAHWQHDGWPKNTVAMTSVEDQRRADERIPQLLAVPAPLRGLSCEPLLGPVDLFSVGGWENAAYWWGRDIKLDWVIAGGESGPGARPMHPDWARSLRDQCKTAKVPFFYKQTGEWVPWIPMNGNPQNKPVQHVMKDGSAYFPGNYGSSLQSMIRVGKKVSGRLLDGREHNEFPEVRQ